MIIESSQGKAGRREWIGLAVIALPCLVYAMDLTVLNLALPAVSAALEPSSAELLWIVDIYGFMVAAFLITMGTLGDRIGRRRLLLIGAAAFGMASILAAFASSAPMLIAMRALLGVAGATLAPSTMSLIRNMFHDAHQRQFAIGIWIASFSFGGAIGPLVGGVLLQYFWWGAVFLVAVPVMLLLLLLGPRFLPEYKDPKAGRIDALSVALSLSAVLAVIYGLKQLAEHGPGWGSVAVTIAGIGGGALFVRRQSRLAYPLMDLALFRIPSFSAAISAYGLSSLAMFGIYIFIAQYLQLVLALTPMQAGLATIPWALAFIVGSMLTPRLVRRMPAVTILTWGLAVAAVGFCLIGWVATRQDPSLLIVGTIIMSLGLAPVFTLGNDMIIGSAPAERAGAASAMAETASEFSGAFGIAMLGSLGAVLYRQGLNDSIGGDVSSDLHNAALATLGGAVAAAQSIAGPTGEALASASRAAFADAMQIVSWTGAAIVLGAGIVCWRILRFAGEVMPDPPDAALPASAPIPEREPRINTEPLVPNDETIAAMKEARNIVLDTGIPGNENGIVTERGAKAVLFKDSDGNIHASIQDSGRTHDVRPVRQQEPRYTRELLYRRLSRRAEDDSVAIALDEDLRQPFETKGIGQAHSLTAAVLEQFGSLHESPLEAVDSIKQIPQGVACQRWAC